MDRLHQNDRGVREFFGKRYMWLLNDRGVMCLHKVDDRGGGDWMALDEFRARERLESEQGGRG